MPTNPSPSTLVSSGVGVDGTAEGVNTAMFSPSGLANQISHVDGHAQRT